MAVTSKSNPVGDAVKARRIELGMTQQEFAAMLLRTQSWISKVEVGRQRVADVDELRELAAQLGVPVQRFGLLPAPIPADQADGDTSAVSAPAATRRTQLGSVAPIGLPRRRTHLSLRPRLLARAGA